MSNNWTYSGLIEALKTRFGPPRYAFFEEVGNSVGFPSSRFDGLAMAMWRSLGLEIHGLEIKMWRPDWLREMKKPSKAEGLFCYCDRFWLVIPDRCIVKPGELPPKWGLLVGDSVGNLRQEIPAPKLSAVMLDRHFIASILRKAYKAEMGSVHRERPPQTTVEQLRDAEENMKSALTRFENRLACMRCEVENLRKEIEETQKRTVDQTAG